MLLKAEPARKSRHGGGRRRLQLARIAYCGEKDRRCGEVCIRRRNCLRLDSQVATLVMEEQVGRFAVGDLGKISLYSDKKENLGNCFRPTKEAAHPPEIPFWSLMSVEECSGEGGTLEESNRCCWYPTKFSLAAKRVLVMVKYEAAERQPKNNSSCVGWRGRRITDGSVLDS